jgi:DnaJ domain
MSIENKTFVSKPEQSFIPTQSHIEILGLGAKPYYSRQEIKDAYRKMSKILHPDVGGVAKDFFSLCEAYNAILEESYQLSARPSLLESELKYCVEE